MQPTASSEAPVVSSTGAVGRLTTGSREQVLDSVEHEAFDVLVIGGGITGAGVAREAAARGLRVALVEAEDFAAGTSSRSSKLIHGGLRYLALGEVGLVRETALERKAVHAMAPHLAEPSWMVVPARNRATLMKFRAGIATYEKLGSVDPADRHQLWGPDELAQREPRLRVDLHGWAIAYREYVTDDARLVLAVLRAAVSEGTVAVSRLPVIGLRRTDGHITGARCRCVMTSREVEVRADLVVNAAGPWVEGLARMEADPPRTRLHLSKGVHVVVARRRLPVNHLVILNAHDKRSIFVVPRGETVAIGTTDTSYSGAQFLWPEIDLEDVTYLLDPLPRYFDADPLAPSDVLAAWSGLRPLVARDHKEPREMSRKEELWTGPGGMVNVAGGKLTGFRHMAERIVDLVGEELDRELPAGPGTRPVPGGDVDPDLSAAAAHLASATGVDRTRCDRLVRLYGSEAGAVIDLGADPVVTDGLVLRGEVAWAVTVEAATTLEDVVHRRTRAAWYLPDEREQLTPAVGEIMAELLGWDTEYTERSVADVRHRFDQEMSFLSEDDA